MDKHPKGDSDEELSREDILDALRVLSEELGKQEITGEICLFGGTAMILAFSARVSTKDVDAIFKPTQLVREIAMKCMASRIDYSDAEAGDVRDIRLLIQKLGLKTVEEALRIIEKYYPPEQIPLKAKYLVETLFEKGQS